MNIDNHTLRYRSVALDNGQPFPVLEWQFSITIDHIIWMMINNDKILIEWIFQSNSTSLGNAEITYDLGLLDDSDVLEDGVAISAGFVRYRRR